MARPWTEPPALRASLARRWQRGELLREWLAPGSLFPLRLALRGPTARELSEDFAAARDWVRRWQREAERAPLTLEWRSRSHRQLGENQLPTAVVIEEVDGALSLLKEQKAARQAAACFHTIVDRQPALRA